MLCTPIFDFLWSFFFFFFFFWNKKFYMELRSKHRGADSTPITTRQIESLIRLAEARARLELREFITVQVCLYVLGGRGNF